MENHRTSFSDLLSLASVFNGDIRRALLSLQVRLQTGSTSSQKTAAPVLEPNIVSSVTTTVPAGTLPQLTADAGAKSSGCGVERDSGDEFVVIRRRKRRALRVASDDDDSRPPSASLLPPDITDNSGQLGSNDSLPVVTDNSGQQGCSDARVNDCEHSAAGVVTGTITDQFPVALDAQLAPPVHRLDFASVGGLESLTRDKLQVRQLMPAFSTTNCCRSSVSFYVFCIIFWRLPFTAFFSFDCSIFTRHSCTGRYC